MSHYKYTTSSVEKDRVMDILMTHKHLTDMYNNAANEVDCSVMHNEMLNILKEEHELEHELYNAVKKRGWYTAKMAQTDDVNKVQSEFENIKKDMGI